MQCYYNLQKARQWCNQLLLWRHHVGTMQAKLFHNVGIYWKKIATTAVSPPLHCGIWLTVVGSVFQIDSQWIEDAFKVDGLPDTLVGAHSHGLVCVVVACQKTD